MTAGTGGANLRQQDTRFRCQVSGPESLLLSSHWSLCAVKCRSKASNRAAPYACGSFYPNLFPLMGLGWNPDKRHENPADSFLQFFLCNRFLLTLSRPRSVINTKDTLILHAPRNETCYVLTHRCYLTSFHLFVCCRLSRHLWGLTTTPKRPFGSSVLFWVPTLAHSFESRLNSCIVYVLESDTGLLTNPRDYQNQSKNPRPAQEIAEVCLNQANESLEILLPV